MPLASLDPFRVVDWHLFSSPLPSISSLLSWFSSHHQHHQASTCPQLPSLYSLQMPLFCVSSATSTFLPALLSPLVHLPSALSLSICSHLLLGCKPPGGSNGQTLGQLGENSINLSILGEVFISPLSLLANLPLPLSSFWPTEACLSPLVSALLLPPLFSPQREWWQPRLIFQATLRSLSPPLTPLTWA